MQVEGHCEKLYNSIAQTGVLFLLCQPICIFEGFVGCFWPRIFLSGTDKWNKGSMQTLFCMKSVWKNFDVF